MGSHTLVLITILGALCVAQALRCNFCNGINKENPKCDKKVVKECSSGLDSCIKIKFHEPAYGEVRRCGKAEECFKDVPPQVETSCCTTDLCN